MKVNRPSTCAWKLGVNIIALKSGGQLTPGGLWSSNHLLCGLPHLLLSFIIPKTICFIIRSFDILQMRPNTCGSFFLQFLHYILPELKAPVVISGETRQATLDVSPTGSSCVLHGVVGSAGRSGYSAGRRSLRRHHLENMKTAVDEVVAYFGHRHADALIRVTRNNLDIIKKRIMSATAVHYGDSKAALHTVLMWNDFWQFYCHSSQEILYVPIIKISISHECET